MFIQVNIAQLLHNRQKPNKIYKIYVLKQLLYIYYIALSFFQEETKTNRFNIVNGFIQICGELHRARPRYNILNILIILNNNIKI